MSDAACSARSASRSLITTLAPCSESSSAVARPMPRADPVTIATLSSGPPMAGKIGGFACHPFGGLRHPRTGSATLQPVRPPDDVEHDLVGSGPDPVQPEVAPGALDAVLAHVAGAAVDLQALVGHLAAHLRGVQLGHRDLAHLIINIFFRFSFYAF